jgi:hypothetical protein
MNERLGRGARLGGLPSASLLTPKNRRIEAEFFLASG